MNDASAKRLIAIVCSAQALVQIGAFFWPALLPSMMLRWELTNSDAGWITGIFYAAYMVSVPLLVTLTDRVDPRAVYLFGVGCTIVAHSLFGLVADGFWSALALRAIAGVGWAGTYMTGLKLLVDIVWIYGFQFVCACGCVNAFVWIHCVVGLVLAHCRCCWHGRSSASWGNARCSFNPWIRGRLCWTVDHWLDT